MTTTTKKIRNGSFYDVICDDVWQIERFKVQIIRVTKQLLHEELTPGKCNYTLSYTFSYILWLTSSQFFHYREDSRNYSDKATFLILTNYKNSGVSIHSSQITSRRFCKHPPLQTFVPITFYFLCPFFWLTETLETQDWPRSAADLKQKI